MKRTLDVHETAAELGRSANWLARHWRGLVTAQKFPRPVIEQGTLAWSAPKVWAWLDRDLDPKLRRAAAAYRLAEQVLTPAAGSEAAAIADSRARLDARAADKRRL